MRKRQQRHDVIRDIIRDRNVKTQRDLANQLQSAGYECTQATISRDIMDMGLVKSREGYYVLPEEMRLQRMVSELVEEVHVAGNLVVVKTFSGGAAGVSAALDKASLRGALGTVAGDNTIMIAAESPEAAVEVERAIDRLRRLVLYRCKDGYLCISHVVFTSCYVIALRTVSRKLCTYNS